MPGRWGEIPFAALALFLVAGIVVSRLIDQVIFIGLAAGTVALVSAAFLALRHDRHLVALCAGLASVLMDGLMLSLAARDGYASNDLRAFLSRGSLPLGELAAFDGCVAERTNRRADETVTTIALRAFQRNGKWIPCRGGMILRIPVSPTEEGQMPAHDLRIGDRIRGWATWHVPRNYQNPGSSDHAGLLLRRGVVLVGRTKSARLLEIVPGDCADVWTRIATGIQDGFQQSIENLKRSGGQEQAAILSSLVIGNYSDLGAETRTVFQNSGTYHVLVVSGLHVAWIAGVLLLVFRRTRIPPDLSRALVAVLLLAYTSLVGFQASISRAFWMFLLYLLGQVFFRHAAPANVTLAAAFFLLAVRPDWLFDVGFQLSFLSVLAICLMGLSLVEKRLKPLTDPLRHAGQPERLGFAAGSFHRAGRWLRSHCELIAEACADRWRPGIGRAVLALARGAAGAALTIGSMIIVTLSVQIWLEPLLAYHFNRLSWISPVANLLAVPLSSMVLAAGMAAALASHVAFLASPLLQLAGALSQLLLQTVRAASELPGAWQRCPTPPLGVVVGGIAILFAWWFAGWRRKWVPFCSVGLLLACLSAGWPKLGGQAPILRESSGQSVLSMTFLDVGEGDSMIVRLPSGQVWVVDGGGIRQAPAEQESEHGFDVGEAVVSRYLWSQWITRLDRAILSHPDLDHAGGMPALLGNFRTNKLNYGSISNDPFMARILKVAKERGTMRELLLRGQAWAQGDLCAEVFNPPGNGEPRSTNENSLVLQLRYGRFSALLTGDLEKAGEMDLLSRGQGIRSLLLKVAHHGSRAATTETFLDRVQPSWAILSAGRNNPFGHPSREVLFRLLRRGIRPLLTQDQGAVTFETDGERYLLRSHVCGILESGPLPR